jgi:phosphoribosylformylglycinamidine synthase I
MKAAVILFPGSNREGDVARALRHVSGHTPEIVWHAEHALPAGTDLVVLPGGFAYGDYLRCGAIAGRAAIMDAVRAHAARGGYVLGICNGFQILCEAGLLPGVLMRNSKMHFVCRMQHLRVERNDTPFASAYARHQVIKVAIAHGEGNYTADEETYARLEGEGRVAFRYAEPVNGSARDIAGVLNEAGNVLGMMPHPERMIEQAHGGTDGRALFESAMRALVGA